MCGKDRKLLTLKQVAERLQVHYSTVHNWVVNGLIRAYRLPTKPGKRRSYRVDEKEVERLLEQEDE